MTTECTAQTTQGRPRAENDANIGTGNTSGLHQKLDSSQVFRRFYHLREEFATSEYEIACDVKKYLLRAYPHRQALQVINPQAN